MGGNIIFPQKGYPIKILRHCRKKEHSIWCILNYEHTRCKAMKKIRKNMKKMLDIVVPK